MKLCNSTCLAVLVSLTIAIYGCEGRPDRKKLPDFSSLQGWEDTPLPKVEKQPFFVSDTTINEGRKLSSYLTVTMADPMYDSIAISMVTSYEPVAGLLFEKWAKQQKKGILIDLRTRPGNEAHRADFLVKKSVPDDPAVKIPLIFIWDRASAYRFDYLMNALTSIPEIKCSLVSESRLPDGVGRTDCFSPSEPDFDQE